MRGWATRPADPEFFIKAADVCVLYRPCPNNAVVFSVDEKTGIRRCRRKRGGGEHQSSVIRTGAGPRSAQTITARTTMATGPLTSINTEPLLEH